MALFTGFDGWIKGIKDFLDVDDYDDARIKTFLGLAHLRLNRELEGFHMEASTTQVLAIATGVMPIGAFGKIRGLSVAGLGAFRVKGKAEVLDRIARDDHNENIFAIDAGQIFIWPTLGANSSLTIDHYLVVPALSELLDDNIFTEHYADILLYAACLEAAAYMAEDERIPVWAGKYDQCLLAYNNATKHIKTGSTPLIRNIVGRQP